MGQTGKNFIFICYYQINKDFKIDGGDNVAFDDDVVADDNDYAVQ